MSDPTKAQAYAADPACSAWVAANAGSGKTRVLTERVARLLLAGALPEKILCLTYTKAAAAEMQNRLFRMLGGWAMAGDDALRAALTDLADDDNSGDDDGGGGGATPGAEDLASARRLFAKALETPGGLKIQTIHAFCDSLIRRFPLEAGAPPGFRMMEEVEQTALIRDVMEAIAASDVTAEADAFAVIASELGEEKIDDLARQIIKNRASFPEVVDEAAICAALGAPCPPDAEKSVREIAARLDRRAVDRIVAAWAQGTVAEQKRASSAADARAVSNDALLEFLSMPLVTQDLRHKKAWTNGSKAAEPDLEALLAGVADVLIEIKNMRRACAAAERSLDLARFGALLTARYERAKLARSLLDYDDLVNRARDLLTRSESCDWVLYRLDGGIDHVLVDEAQDTSQAQWDVINAIVGEFHAGEGAREAGRTSFVVGDEKQSIYRFQGAAPEMFDEMRKRFAAALAPHGGQREAALAHSFRSAPAILRAVDETFAGERAHGLTARGDPAAHIAFHAKRAGRVEIWPLLEAAPKAADPEPWAPVDMPGKDNPSIRLAGLIADRIKAMVDSETFPGGGRRVRPGDILVLLRKRAPMMRPLINALKSLGVPVAGADRLTLLEELAVKDLLAFMRFAVTPEDDLNLAALLRSPLFDVSEDELRDLAYDRKGALWSALAAAAKAHPGGATAGIVERLSAARNDAGFLRPYEFLEKALSANDGAGRRRMLARLGREAEDPMDELLSQALRYEGDATPSFDGFLSWMRADDAAIKREQESARDEVRVMSVHGAKGLEAPIVILPDTTRKPDDGSRDMLVELPTKSGAVSVWKATKEAAPPVLLAARDARAAAEAGESKRLLYVAMTRAEDWLIVAGAKGSAKAGTTWYDAISAGLERAGAVAVPPPPGVSGEALVLEEAGEAKTAPDAAPPTVGPTLPAAAPDWLRQPIAPAPKARPRRTASTLADHNWRPGSAFAPDVARVRGEAIHAALEYVEAGDDAMARAAGGFELDQDVITGAVDEAKRARSLPEAALFFGPDALVEVGVAVEIGDVRVVGRIDRVAILPDKVVFVDFKSDGAPPVNAADTPVDYLAQMGAYRAALTGLYPEKPVEAYILWTAAPRLDRIDPVAMDAALGAVDLSPLGEDELV